MPCVASQPAQHRGQALDIGEYHDPGAVDRPAADVPRFGSSADRVIVGLATGYRFDALSPFLNSLAATGYDGSVVLYVGGSPPACLADLAAMGVEARPAGPFLNPETDPQLARYAMYLDCLASWPRLLRFAMITDVRDVVFQSDPADFPLLNQARGPVMHSWLESEGTDLVAEPNNRLWLQALHGVAATRLLASQPISCSGISIGNHAGMLAYVARMQEEARRLRGGSRIKGIDQGIHNSLLWNRRPPGSQVNHNGDHVLTLGIASNEAFRIEADQVVLPDGRVPAVLHQWDRHPALKQLVQRRFATATPVPAAAADPARGQVIGWVGADAPPRDVERFLATLRDAAPRLPVRLLGPGLADSGMTAMAARFAADIDVAPEGTPPGDFHQAMLAALSGRTGWWPVLCVDAARSLVLDDPFRTRLQKAPLLAMEGGGMTLDQYEVWRRALSALIEPAAAQAIGRRVPVAPHLLLGRLAGVRHLLGRFRRLRRAHPDAEAFALFQLAAFAADAPAVEVMPNFSLVANLTGFGDDTVTLGAGPLFPDRACAVALAPTWSPRLIGWADTVTRRMTAGEDQ
jgi:hypothetical protein